MDSPSRSVSQSKYNFFVERRDGVMAYNARTGTFALLAPEVAAALRSAEPLPASDDTDALVEMGFLHGGDEVAQLGARYAADAAPGDLELTIAPTLACNRACEYCYQRDRRARGAMSEATQDAALRFTESMVRAGRRVVSCVWYGGEPLLAKEVVVAMSRRLREVVERAGGRLWAQAIVTNATLLDVETARTLASLGIATAQISIDALYDDGEKVRGALDSRGAPSLILRNAIAAKAWLGVGVRVNASVTNKSDLPMILATLRDHGLVADTHLARVDDVECDSGCAGAGGRRDHAGRALPVIQPSGLALSKSEYAAVEFEQVLRRPAFLGRVEEQLTPKSRRCGATRGSLFTIDPEGNLSACWNSVGLPEERIGNVHDVTPGRIAGLVSPFALYDPLRFAGCASCKVLPLCMGGCAYGRACHGSKKPPCDSIRQHIDACVALVGAHLSVHPSASEVAHG